MRGDEQEADTRCGTRGASGHVTAKPSIRNWRVLYKSATYAPKVNATYPGRPAESAPLRAGLGDGRPEPNEPQESAEGIVGDGEVKLVRHSNSRKAESTARPNRIAATEGLNRCTGEYPTGSRDQ